MRHLLIVPFLFLTACASLQSRTGPAMPPVPPLPTVTHITNGAKVFRVVIAEANVVPKVDMPAPLPVSEDAPHHYYGIVEFKSTKDGIEPSNEVVHFGLYLNDAAFTRSLNVGNPKFNRKYKAVIKYPSELPLDALCIWQRRDGPTP